MANNIELFKTYIPLVDEVYKYGSKTAMLDTNQEMVKMAANGKDFLIPKISTSGLGDYERNGKGYPLGSVTLGFETKSPNFDRASKFGVEDQDNTETVGLAFGQLAGTFMREQVVPEIDAFRFAKYTENAGFKLEKELTTGEAVLEAIRDIKVKMDDNEVPEEGRILRITSSLLEMIKSLDTYKSTQVMSSFASIETVPQARFYSAIKQYDGFDDAKFGFEKAEGAKQIGFAIIHPSALIQAEKSVIAKVIDPQFNQTDDKWMFFYHNYGICNVLDNKKNGIGVYLTGAAVAA